VSVGRQRNVHVRVTEGLAHGHNVGSVGEQIVRKGMAREILPSVVPPGAAPNAAPCARDPSFTSWPHNVPLNRK